MADHRTGGEVGIEQGRSVLRRVARILRYRPVRSTKDRVIGGVAGGAAEQLGVDAVLVRLAFVVMSFAGGFGVVVYLLGWARGISDGERPAANRANPRQLVALGMILVGLVLLLRGAGIWFGDPLFLSVALAATGSAIIWTRDTDPSRARGGKSPVRPRGSTGQRLPVLRAVLGLPLILAGMGTFLAANRALAAARNLAFALAVTVTGFGLVLGPWMWRLWRQLSEERGDRIRSEERAVMAAHLHDSVLQTLALIQRTNDSRRMASLARGQERELRTWLYGKTNGHDGPRSLLSAALDETAGRVERLHGVPVDVVLVGDSPLDERLRSLVDAAGEAMHNAAKHSGAAVVSVYVEVEGETARVYVRDEGRGFEPPSVPPDRRGIADSIRHRMHRHGGTAVIESQLGEGTEVRLEMSLRPPS